MATTVILVASFLAVFAPAFALLLAGLARMAGRRDAVRLPFHKSQS